MKNKQYVRICCPHCGETITGELYENTICMKCQTKVNIQCEPNIITDQYGDEYIIYVDRKPCFV